ncbi:MAG: hypothetical protein WBQ94_03620 [Terracidiphilus sp.]
MDNYAEFDRQVRRLHGKIDRESREVLKFIDSHPHQGWVIICARMAASAGRELLELYREMEG